MWKKRIRKRKIWLYKKRLKTGNLYSNLAFLTFIGAAAGLLVLTGVFAWYARDLPRPDKVVRYEGFATRIYDRNDELLYDVYGEQKRTPIELEEVPEHLKNATIAIEDKDFYEHGGFDVRGWLRALYNIVVHRRLQGGSTITQQLVKNVLLTAKRTLPRKIKEFILAVQIEKKYSKDEILQMYLNEAPYGGTAWGVEAAAETYFDKNAKDLNLIESAILAGLPQRPTAYSPFGPNPKAYVGRTKDVLRRMREDGYLTREEEEMALEELEKVEFAENAGNFQAPHFVMYVKQQLVDLYGEKMVEQGGLKVTTTLDLELQEKAQEAVSEEIEKVEYLDITNGAALLMNPQTGEILAMVGSKDYNDPDYDGKVNVTLALRQPGSAIKPVNYLTAFKKGYTPSTLILDTRTEFPGGVGKPPYVPVNYDGKYHGPLQVRYALGSSINLPAVKMLAQVGIEEMLKTAYQMGFTTLQPSKQNLSRFGLSLTLGGGEVKLLDMVSAYSAFANGGVKVEPVAILKVEDRNGKVLQEFKPVKGERVMSEGEAYLINNILYDNNARLITFGENSAIRIKGYQVAVKTGTTDDKRDNWTVGWNPRFITGVWVGNNDNSEMKQVASGVTGAAPIWRRIVYAAAESLGTEDFPVPDSIVVTEVDLVSGFRCHDGFPCRTEQFIKGRGPVEDDPVHVMLEICKDTGKLASRIDHEKGLVETKEYFIFKENDPTSGDPEVNRWQEGINAWIGENYSDDSRYHPPTETCDSYHSGEQERIHVSFEKPGDHEELNENNFEVKIKATTPHEVVKVELRANGALKKTWTGGPYETILYLEKGTHTLKAKAIDSRGNEGEAEIKIGVKVPWDWSPTPTATPTLTPSPTP